jgi:PIN domain nuclease of toxin-antitoxin system
MRYYLDTNILVFVLSRSKDNLDTRIEDIIFDFSNILYTSSIAANELILLYKIGKIELINCKSARDVLSKIEKSGIKIVYYNQYHLLKYSSLELADGHKDMNDHAIIAQAISDKIPLISSDHAFKHYQNQGLQLVFNKR